MVVGYMLRDAAVCGDEETFRRLVQDGEDANAVIGALVLGAPSFDDLDACRVQTSASGRLSILSFLLENRCLSLYNLNAPHSMLKGLTPLGMATYLNRLEFVTTFLEKGDGLVLVDGMDDQRATPIMYAARDGHVDILRYLISQDARITSVDWQHRSVLFYSTSSPQCLWECEVNLRLQRAQSLLAHGKKRKFKLSLQHDPSEYSTLACMYQQHTAYPLSPSTLQSCVQRLISSITSSDLSAVQSFLFPSQDSQLSALPAPVLVNLPDENDWSPIHYCVTSPRPSTAILDALYLAGADLGIYTADNTMTPLHALARLGGSCSTVSFRLYAFIVHFVRDLGAPLDAVDQNGETCIHVAARYGRCADILMALLECDTDGVVAKIRNNDGQTAYEVAKLEFRSVFEQDDGASIRPGSAASLRTIKPSYSSSSLGTTYSSSSSSSGSLEDEDEDSSVDQHQFPRPISREKESLRSTTMNSKEARRLLESLEYISKELQRRESRTAFSASKGKAREPANLTDIEDLLQRTRQSSAELLEHYRRLIDAETDDLHAAQGVHSSLEQLIMHLEQRALANEEEERAQTPSMTSYRRLSETPSLVESGSSASLNSLSDLAALVTPAGSPRASLVILNTPKQPDDYKVSEGGGIHVTAENILGGSEEELDFACALAAGTITRQRRSGIFALGNVNTSIFQVGDAGPSVPVEEGVDLISIPPVRVPEVQDIIVQPEQPPDTSATKRESWSWLDPYVRRANSGVLKAHLANLLEIEKMLFGAEDREMEDVPSPGTVSDEKEDVWCWRDGVDALHDQGEDGNGEAKLEGGVSEEEIGNFLDMFGAEEEIGSGHDRNYEAEAGAPFLDLFDPTEGEGDEDDTECDSKRASTVKPLPSQKKGPFGNEPLSASDILRIATRELYAVEEAMLTACRSIETAQRYTTQAERLTNDIFQKIERSVRTARLASSQAFEESHAFPLPPSSGYPSRLKHRPSNQSLLSASPSPSFSSPSPHKSPSWSTKREPESPAGLIALADDIKWLRHLLERKIPIWLDAAAYDVDKAGSWVGIVQDVVRNVRRTKL